MARHKTERYYLGHAKEQLMQYRLKAGTAFLPTRHNIQKEAFTV